LSIAKDVGIPVNDYGHRTLSGPQIDSMPTNQLEELVDNISVFYRYFMERSKI
jgi:hypothetical protein